MVGSTAVSGPDMDVRSGGGITLTARMEPARIPSTPAGSLPPWPAGRPLRATADQLQRSITLLESELGR